MMICLVAVFRNLGMVHKTCIVTRLWMTVLLLKSSYHRKCLFHKLNSV